jgi:hypothetical protein
LTVRLRGQRSARFRALGFHGVSDVTTSKSALHFVHVTVWVAAAMPQSGPPDTSAS